MNRDTRIDRYNRGEYVRKYYNEDRKVLLFKKLSEAIIHERDAQVCLYNSGGSDGYMFPLYVEYELAKANKEACLDLISKEGLYDLYLREEF